MIECILLHLAPVPANVAMQQVPKWLSHVNYVGQELREMVYHSQKRSEFCQVFRCRSSCHGRSLSRPGSADILYLSRTLPKNFIFHFTNSHWRRRPNTSLKRLSCSSLSFPNIRTSFMRHTWPPERLREFLAFPVGKIKVQWKFQKVIF